MSADFDDVELVGDFVDEREMDEGTNSINEIMTYPEFDPYVRNVFYFCKTPLAYLGGMVRCCRLSQCDF